MPSTFIHSEQLVEGNLQPFNSFYIPKLVFIDKPTQIAVAGNAG